jgi:hypothetical protein
MILEGLRNFGEGFEHLKPPPQYTTEQKHCENLRSCIVTKYFEMQNTPKEINKIFCK